MAAEPGKRAFNQAREGASQRLDGNPNFLGFDVGGGVLEPTSST